MLKKRGKTKNYLKYHLFQFMRYTAVGTSSTVLQIFLIYIFTDLSSIHYLVSGILAYLLSGFYNFYFNKTWTFREKFNHKFLEKYSKFLSLNIMAFFSNIFLLYVFTDVMHIYYLWSQFFAILCISVLNFLVNKFIIFKKDYFD